jgi:7-carboxy-7-deazaguanine synthase (Cx14CxxC type)
LFYTLQGEGRNVGRAAVFCRFSGCNLWSGREADRERGPSCSRWCDTEFVGTDGLGGGHFESPEALAAAAAGYRPLAGPPEHRPLLVCTGGEPLLQLDEPLVKAFRTAGFEVAIETNGTLPLVAGIDWVCVSPKAGAPLVVTSGDELKLVFPQAGMDPAELAGLDFRYFFLQPLDGPELKRNTRLAVEYCLAHPQWRLSLQTHKLLGIR